jgi:hypothetical protein
MEVDEEYGRGGHDVVKVTWDEDVFLKRIALNLPFKQASTYSELYAGVKYYFLLAVEAGVEDFHQDFIPVNRSFVQHLTGLCQHYDYDPSIPASSVWEYHDEEKASPPRPANVDRRRPPDHANQRGVARMRQVQIDSNDSLEVDTGENEDDNGEETESSQFKSVGTHHNGAEIPASSSDDDDGDENTQTAPRSRDRKATSRHLNLQRSRDDSQASRVLDPAGGRTLGSLAEHPYNPASTSSRNDLPRLIPPHVQRNHGAARDPTALREAASSGLETIHEDMDDVPKHGQHPFLRSANNVIFSVSDQHAAKLGKEHTEMAYSTMIEPILDRYHHKRDQERFQASVAYSPAPYKELNERQTNGRAERLPNPLANRRPSLDLDQVISSSALKQQKKCIDGRIEKTISVMKDGFERMNRLQRVRFNVKAEMVKVKRREDEKKGGHGRNMSFDRRSI